LNADRSPRSNEDLLARMYRHVAAARELTDDPAIRARLQDLALYTRYVELYLAYDDATGPARQAAMEQLLRFAYRIRHTLMISAHSTYTNLPYRDRSVSVPDQYAWDVPEERNAWKSSEPFREEEITALLAAGIEAHRMTVLDFEPVPYSQELVPAAAALGLPEVPLGSFGSFRGRHTAFTWFPPDQPELALRVTGGLIAHYRDRGNVRLALYSPDEVTLQPVAVDEHVPPDGNEYPVVLRSPYRGLHRLEWSDGGDRTSIVWPEHQPLTMRSGRQLDAVFLRAPRHQDHRRIQYGNPRRSVRWQRKRGVPVRAAEGSRLFPGARACGTGRPAVEVRELHRPAAVDDGPALSGAQCPGTAPAPRGGRGGDAVSTVREACGASFQLAML